jgi:hypothetical protein
MEILDIFMILIICMIFYTERLIYCMEKITIPCYT